MEYITVVNAPMGAGKTTAAINYMNAHPEKKFLYVTPFLDEVARVCECCECDQPEDAKTTKTRDLLVKLQHGGNVATSHILYSMMTDELLEEVRKQKYNLIIDEAPNAVEALHVSASDIDLMLKSGIMEVGNEGLVIWKHDKYEGAFGKCREAATRGLLYYTEHSLVRMMKPDLLYAFEDVILMTYRYYGQYFRCYCDWFRIPYKVVGVEVADGVHRFADREIKSSAIDYRSLITWFEHRRTKEDVDQNKMYPGDDKNDLSKSWYMYRGAEKPVRGRDESFPRKHKTRNESIHWLHTRLKSFVDNQAGTISDCLWCCFKDDLNRFDCKIDSNGNIIGRLASAFLHVNARATNKYKDRHYAAYLVNRFADPNISKFFAQRGISVDADDFALGEALQWIWRSAIRDGEPITLYVPSARMKRIIKKWLNDMAKGGDL